MKNNLDTFNDTFEGDEINRNNTVLCQNRNDLISLRKKRNQSVDPNQHIKREDSVNLLDENDSSSAKVDDKWKHVPPGY